jgi:putative spermidine/putrescine transport system permease protein
METRGTRIVLWAWAGLIFLFLWIPLAIMGVYAFNSSNIQSWPIPGFTTKWFSEAWNDVEVRDALGSRARACWRRPSRSSSLAGGVRPLARAFLGGTRSRSLLLPIALRIITGLAPARSSSSRHQLSPGRS